MRRDPTAAELEAAARIFKALAHPDRLRLTCLLAGDGFTTQKALVDELGWPQSTVARHVGLLRERGLVAGTRIGPEVRLEANSLPRLLLDAVCAWLEGREDAA